MTDVQWLFLALALFYCWECACWLRRGSRLFRTWTGRRWIIRPPSSLWGNHRGGFILAPPFPPLGTIIEAQDGGSFDLPRARERLEVFQRESRKIRWLANILFGYLFVAAPALIYGLGLRFTWIPLLAGMFLITVATGILFARAHRTLYGERASDTRFSAALTIGLSPANAVRACDSLSRRLFTEFHPLCLARLLCGDASFREQAARWLARVRYPNPTEAAMTGGGELEAFLVSQKLQAGELLAPPVEREPGSVTYCPRCRSLFVAQTGTCADCGVTLLRLPS